MFSRCPPYMEQHLIPCSPSNNPTLAIPSVARLLERCISSPDPASVEQAYSLYRNHGLHHHPHLGCLLIRSFASCGILDKAYEVFHEMLVRNVYAWTAIIAAFAGNSEGERAWLLYEEMVQLRLSVMPNCHTFVAILKACACPPLTLMHGMLVHFDIVKRDFAQNCFIGSSLVAMYANHGSLRDASCVFHHLTEKDDVSWCVLISGYVKHRCASEAFEFFVEMRRKGVEPNKPTFVNLLTLCTDLSLTFEGEKLHAEITNLGLEYDARLTSSLVKMYSRMNRSRMDDARQMFYKIPPFQRDLVSWNTMIVSLADNECHDEAFQLLEQMKSEGMNPNEATYLSLIRGSTDIDVIRNVHDDVVKLGLQSHLHVVCSLLDVYIKCNFLDDAHGMFHSIPQDVVLWSAMIKGYVDLDRFKEAMELYVKMLQKHVTPDEYTYVYILQACSNAATLCFGFLVHSDVIEQRLDKNPFIANNIVDMYVKCGELGCARNVFDKLLVQDTISFSYMIGGYVDCNRCLEALQLFSQLWQQREPDKVTYLPVVGACTSVSAVKDALIIYGAIVQQNLELDPMLGSASIDMLAKCSSLLDACKVFELQPCPTIPAYSAMISAHVENSQYEMALSLFYEIEEEGLWPDSITYSCTLRACSGLGALENGRAVHALIEKQGISLNPLLLATVLGMYAKCGSLVDAHHVLSSLHSPDAVSCCTLLSSYVHHGCTDHEVIELIGKMQVETHPNEVAYLCMLKACATFTIACKGLSIHSEIQKLGLESNPILQIAMMNMYCKCGNLEDACKIFSTLEVKNVVSWSIIVAGYVEHGLVSKINQSLLAIQDFGILPDDPFFLRLLYSCSHAGLLEEAKFYFSSMIKHNHTPRIEHSMCIVDMFCRLGCLNTAEILAQTIPFQPNSVIWVTLLTSCTRRNDLGVAQTAYDSLTELECGNTAFTILM